MWALPQKNTTSSLLSHYFTQLTFLPADVSEDQSAFRGSNFFKYKKVLCKMSTKSICSCCVSSERCPKARPPHMCPPSFICRKPWMFTRIEDTRKGGFGGFSIPLEPSSSVCYRHSNRSVLSLFCSLNRRWYFLALQGFHKV